MKKEVTQSFFSVSKIFGMNSTKNPERLMDDVLEIKILNPKCFVIKVLDKDGSIKPLMYEVKDLNIPKKIKAKIHYIKYIKLNVFIGLIDYFN